MMRHLVSLVFLFCISIFHAKALEKVPDSARFFGVHVMPFQYFCENPNLRFGIEQMSYNKSLCLDIGFGNNSLTKTSVMTHGLTEKYTYFTIRPAVKFYLNRMELKRFYTSVELYFEQYKSILYNNSFIPNNSNYVFDYEKACLNTKNTGINWKTGYDILIFNKIHLDFFFDIGFIIQNLNYSDVKYIQSNGTQLPYTFPVSIWRKLPYAEGTRLFLKANFGFKIGFLFMNNEQTSFEYGFQ